MGDKNVQKTSLHSCFEKKWGILKKFPLIAIQKLKVPKTSGADK